MATKTAATVDDVLRLGEQGERYELVDGELVPMSPTNFEHARIELHVGVLFSAFVLPRQLGEVLVGEPLFRLDQAGQIGRAPDVAFVRRERLRGQPNLQGVFHGAPDLAVEIVSPNDTAADVQRKVDDWLEYGTLAILLMYPAMRSVVFWRASGAMSLHGDDDVNLDPAIPGFRCKTSELFPPSIEDMVAEASPE